MANVVLRMGENSYLKGREQWQEMIVCSRIHLPIKLSKEQLGRSYGSGDGKL
jgi:hypothetical protein